nr:reverse transcriptase domain-containing protein [Tanacetum cinerariifolium]
MRTRSQSRNNFPQQEASLAIVEPLRIEFPFQEDPPKDPPEVSMADDRTMAELLRAPTKGYEDAIVIPEIAANNFELKHSLINLVQNKQFFGHDKEDPHAHIPISSDVAELKDMVKALLLDKKNQSLAPVSSPTPVKAEKSHFMVKEGIVLGHKTSKNRIEVDKAKVDVIAKLPHPTTIKGIRSFLGHAGFYRRFIKDFSKIARLMTCFLEKDTPFFFFRECVEAFQTIKRKLTEAPILIAPDWDLPFELMCDANDFAIGAVLGQRQEKHFRPIHYASKTMTEAELNYTTTEKEMLAVVYAFEKLWSYLIKNKSIVYTDHSGLKYLFAKKDSKARLLR